MAVSEEVEPGDAATDPCKCQFFGNLVKVVCATCPVLSERSADHVDEFRGCSKTNTVHMNSAEMVFPNQSCRANSHSRKLFSMVGTCYDDGATPIKKRVHTCNAPNQPTRTPSSALKSKNTHSRNRLLQSTKASSFDGNGIMEWPFTFQ